MNKSTIIKYLFLFAALYFTSCRKVLIKKNITNQPTACFNLLWETMRNKYTFFSYKHVNWDSIYAMYQPQINDQMSDQELFDILAKVLGSVRDGHTSLYAPNDTFKYYYANGYAKNYDESFVREKYLLPNQYKTTESIEYCTLQGSIGYIHYPSFKNEITQKSIDAILQSFVGTKGLIIDIRNNTGGDNKNILRLIEHFVSGQTTIGMSIEKKDAGLNSFTDPTIISISPKGELYTNPIMVLTNRTVFSSANIFAGFISQLPQVKIIGDITGGGTGIPTSNDLPNGWRFRYSSSIVRLADGSDFEDGLLPTISVSTDSLSQSLSGKDAIIERAITEIQ